MKTNETGTVGKSGDSPRPASESATAAARFLTTHWTNVLAAGRSESTSAQAALSGICQTYWHPVFHYVRRRGYSESDAQDLTQEFFARLLAGRWLTTADPERGRFRSFLLTALQHFLANEWHRARAQKRGGDQRILSLDEPEPDGRHAEPSTAAGTPDQAFERQWALALLDGVLARLEIEYAKAGRADLFEALQSSLSLDRHALDYPSLALKLGLSEGAVRVAVHRLRQGYRRALREEVARTVGGEEEVEAEMRYLFTVLSRPVS